MKTVTFSLKFQPSLNAKILDSTSKVILPESALIEFLAFRNSTSIVDNQEEPFYLLLENSSKTKKFYSTALEFTADEGYIEMNIFSLLDNGWHDIKEHDIISISLLPIVFPTQKLTIEPLDCQSFYADFKNIKDILEGVFSKYSILFQDQIISFYDETFEKQYSIKITKLHPDFENINMVHYNHLNMDCLSLLNVDVEVDLYDKELEKKLKRERDEILQKNERLLMRKEDKNMIIKKTLKKKTMVVEDLTKMIANLQ